jgi:hypothetical protein
MGLEARALYVLANRADFAADTRSAVHQELQALEDLFKHGYPSLKRVLAVQVRTHRLARRMLDEALTFTPRQRLRHGVQAGVGAELLAAALADYGLARENVDASAIRLGEADRVV